MPEGELCPEDPERPSVCRGLAAHGCRTQLSVAHAFRFTPSQMAQFYALLVGQHMSARPPLGTPVTSKPEPTPSARPLCLTCSHSLCRWCSTNTQVARLPGRTGRTGRGGGGGGSRLWKSSVGKHSAPSTSLTLPALDGAVFAPVRPDQAKSHHKTAPTLFLSFVGESSAPFQRQTFPHELIGGRTSPKAPPPLPM